ncbi:MAG: isocitrate/isopropylmalate dehydrogenase family protein [Candidatus Eremiobacteraeota bacterium]|nr:isocitrate/isopropylmalate dehydrogenase family protein [Candidatus Eremiobacteraeota bacterium]
MAKHKIAWLPGDGVGNEVMEAAKIVLDTLGLDAEYKPGDVGWEFWKSEGNPLPDRTIKLLKECDVCLFGAITSKPKDEAAKELDPKLRDKGFVYFSPIVNLRQILNLSTNMRPCKAFKGNPLNYRDDIDLVVFRENTEGMYCGIEFHPVPDELKEVFNKLHKKMARFMDTPGEDMAISTRLMTRKGCENIVRDAFEYAKKHGYPTVTVVEKPNVLRETGGLMIRTAREVAKDYPGIELWETNIDAMCMWLVKNPQKYGVLVAENLFGDIISDLSAQLVGGLGFASSGNISDSFALFEPTHGSAPKYAGQYKVNPTAMLLSAKMMLDYLGETKMANVLSKSIAEVVEEGKYRTYDMGGNSTTLEVAEEVARKIERKLVKS